jgi:hypothetical protein
MLTLVRHCDDLVIYANDRTRLQHAWKRVEERCGALRLRQHGRKCRLRRTTEAVSFVGFVLARVECGLLVRLVADTVRWFRGRMGRDWALFRAGLLGAGELVARVRAWLAHAGHGRAAGLCRGAVALGSSNGFRNPAARAAAPQTGAAKRAGRPVERSSHMQDEPRTHRCVHAA